MPDNEQTLRVVDLEDKKDQKTTASDDKVQLWKAFFGNVVNNGTALSAGGADYMVYELKNGIQDVRIAY